MAGNSNLPARLSGRAPSPEELLLANFYAWERRGRGWQVWDAPVDLEPPFRPFFHWLPRTPRVVDDGRQPTLLSGLVGRIHRFLNPPSLPADATSIDLPFEEPDPPFVESSPDYIEIDLVLPEGMDASKPLSDQFLISLGLCRHPVAFEFIGLPEAIHLQIACHEDDAYQVSQSLAAHFPASVRTERREFLRESWHSATGEERLFVDFGLSREFMFPLGTVHGFAVDPLIPMVGALEKLEPGEVAAFQILFEPARHAWASSILRAVGDGDGGAFFSEQPGTLKLAQQKVSRPLYAAAFRIAVKSASEERLWWIARSMAGTLTQLADPAGNELIPLENEEGLASPDLREALLLSRLSLRSGMILNCDELVSLMHLPSASVRSRKFRRLIKKTRRLPDLALGHELILGTNEHEGVIQTATLSPDQRVRHTYVLGVPGTGKSTFLQNLILQDIEAGKGLAVLDPHGDLIDQILERIPEHRQGDVILFDPADEDYPIGFNILSAHSSIEKHLLSSDLGAVFKRLSTSWGDQMTSVLGNAILAFLECEQGGTLADLRRFLIEKDYRTEFLKTVQDREIVYYWLKEFPLITGRPQVPILTRLDTFLRPKLVRNMVAQHENRLDFAEIMNGRKIFLGKLAQGAIGEENAYLLGSLIVAKFHQLTLARQEVREADREPFTLFIDEFHNFVTPSMASILTGARKFRLGLVLAHQEFRQIRNEEVASAVLAHPYSRVCFRLGDQDAAKLAAGFSFFDAKDLQNLGTGEALCRMERAEFDFNMRTSPLAPVDEALGRERRAEIVAGSRQRFGTPRAVVEEYLAKNLHGMEVARDEAAEDLRNARKPPASAKQPGPPEPPSPAPAPKSNPPEQNETAMPKVLPPNPDSESHTDPATSAALKGEAAPPAKRGVTSGRGGPEHQYLQKLFKKAGQERKWITEIEWKTPDGAGSVDVMFMRDGRTIACEICVTTPTDKEIANIEKCFKAGMQIVVSVSDEVRTLKTIEKMAKARFEPEVLDRVRFLTPDAFISFLDEVSAGITGRVETILGFKVKTTVSGSLTKAEETGATDAVTGAVVDSIQGKMKGGAKGKRKEEDKRKE